MDSSAQKYVPGVCNIGPAEEAGRRMFGRIGTVSTMVIWAAFLLFHAPQALRLILFLPAFAAAMGYLQSELHFCAGFGLKGVYNVMEKAGTTETVEQAGFRKKDRQKAIRILLGAALIAAVVALLAFAVV
jgi:cytochrome b subunit of formate dehydrogenase